MGDATRGGLQRRPVRKELVNVLRTSMTKTLLAVETFDRHTPTWRWYTVKRGRSACLSGPVVEASQRQDTSAAPGGEARQKIAVVHVHLQWTP